MNANFKTFQAWANRNTNTLPILDYVKVESGIATISDLETTVQFTADLKDGYYAIRMNEPFFIKELDDHYPAGPIMVKTLASAEISASVILQYNSLRADDALRPVMNGIYISSEGICASDAHVLRYATNFAYKIDDNFDAILPAVTPLLARCKVSPTELITLNTFECEKGYKHLRCYFSDCILTTRAIEGKYPNYISVVPTSMTDRKFISLSVATIQEMTKTAKAFKIELAKVSDAGMTIENIDFNLKKKWVAPTRIECPKRKPDGVIMPMMVGEDFVADSSDNYLIGLNPVRLSQFITLFKGNVILGFEEPSRPICVWLESSERPAAAKQKATPKPKAYQPDPAPRNPKALAPIPDPTPAPVPEPTPIPEPKRQPKWANAPTEFVLVDYSPKAVALFGPTKAIKNKLMELHGAFSPYLRLNKEPTPGWVFSKKRESAVRELIAS